MKRSLAMFVFLALFGLVATARAQDPVKVGPDVYKCGFENERVRVCEVTFKPGTKIGMHSHPDHVAYVVKGGKLKISPAGGKAQENDVKPGQVLWIPAESHAAENPGTTELKVVIVELKEGGAAAAK